MIRAADNDGMAPMIEEDTTILAAEPDPIDSV